MNRRWRQNHIEKQQMPLALVRFAARLDFGKLATCPTYLVTQHSKNILRKRLVNEQGVDFLSACYYMVFVDRDQLSDRAERA